MITHVIQEFIVTRALPRHVRKNKTITKPKPKQSLDVVPSASTSTMDYDNQKIELLNVAIKRVIKENKDEDDHLLLSRLLSQVCELVLLLAFNTTFRSAL